MIVFCYIDPGTGSMLLQIVLAGLVGFFAFFRKGIHRLFGKNNPKPNDPPHSEIKNTK
jgi:hypothetical protein